MAAGLERGDRVLADVGVNVQDAIRFMAAPHP
jgi:hypothetical protein